MTATIWLDLTYASAVSPSVKSDSVATHLALCKIDSYLITFRNLDKCIEYIANLQEGDNKVVLIITNGTQSLSSVIDPLLQLSQIDSIYVVHSDETNTPTETFPTSTTRLRGVYTDRKILCNQLSQIPHIQRRRRRDKFSLDDFTVTSLMVHLGELPISPPTAASSTTINQLQLEPPNDPMNKRQEAEFMYAQFLRDILIRMSSAEKEMIEFCRQKYTGNDSELNVIDEFEAYYDASNAIFWYTRDTFLYRLLNKALREQDIDTLFSLRYFIKDLHSQLKQRHDTQQQTSTIVSTTICDDKDSTTEIVYRGQLMNSDEFERKIRQNLKGFFCVNSFFSTTQHENLASVYAGNVTSNQVTPVQSVLFRIDIDKSVNKFPYANISTESAFEKVENEILFTMGAVFRIESIDLAGEGFWNVHLKLTGEEDEELKTLSEYKREELIPLDPLASLATLLLRMGEYSKAERYYHLALQDPIISANLILLSAVHNDLGVVYDEIGLTEKAIEHFEKSLAIDLQRLPATDPEFATIYNNLGSVYRQQGDYDQALSYFHKALTIEQASPDQDQTDIAFYYNNIGLVYNEQQRYSEALQMFEMSLEIRLKVLPGNHPDISESYNNISRIYDSLGDYDKAIEYMKKTLQNDLHSLPPNHPLLATTYNNLAKTLYTQGKRKEALDYMKKAHDILFKSLPTDPKVILIQTWIVEKEQELSETLKEENN